MRNDKGKREGIWKIWSGNVMQLYWATENEWLFEEVSFAEQVFYTCPATQKNLTPNSTALPNTLI